MATGLKPALAVALVIFCLACCALSASAISCGKFWLLPDGKRLPSGAGASCLARPELVEIGIATDAIFAVIVMGYWQEKYGVPTARWT